jgi:hypothetical protein
LLSLFARVALRVEDIKSLTAKDAKAAKENNSLNAKAAKATKEKLSKTDPRTRRQRQVGNRKHHRNVNNQKHLLYATLGAVPSRPSGLALELIITSFAARLVISFAD